LQKIAGENITFLGLISDNKMPELYNRAQALIFPQEEDFGLVPLESMASGRPVIAYRAGGALETVIEGKTGIFFDDQTEISLALAVGQYYQTKFEPKHIREHALKFDKAVFQKKILNLIHSAENSN
jgi:glycosyltransferase involved in cell wall biosynthesis